MERYRNFVRIEQMKENIRAGRIENALKLAEEINPAKVKSNSDLGLIADLYLENGKLQKGSECLMELYSRKKTRSILMQLVNLSLRIKKVEAAEKFYAEFKELAPNDFYNYIFRYNIDKLKGRPISVLIDTLEKLKKAEYIESWAYELAKLYHKAGERDKCIAECNDIEVWFGDGEYVERARALKAYYTTGAIGAVDGTEEVYETPADYGRKAAQAQNPETVQNIAGTQDTEDVQRIGNAGSIEAAQRIENAGSTEAAQDIESVQDTPEGDNSDNASASQDSGEEVFEIFAEEGADAGSEVEEDGDVKVALGDQKTEDIRRVKEVEKAEEVEEVDIEELHGQAPVDVTETELTIGELLDSEEAVEKEAPHAETPQTEAPKAEILKTVETKAEVLKTVEPKVVVPKTEAPEAEAPKAEEPQAAPAQDSFEDIKTAYEPVKAPEIMPAAIEATEQLEADSDEALIMKLLAEEESALASAVSMVTGDYDETPKKSEPTEPVEVNIGLTQIAEHEYKGLKDVKISPDSLLAGFLKKEGVTLEEYFGYFAYQPDVRQQLIKVLEILLNPQIKNKCLVITGEPDSGIKKVIKGVTKILYQSGFLTGQQVAVTEAFKFNTMKIGEKVDKLIGCCFTINHAGAISAGAAEKLLKANESFAGKTAVVLTDTRSEINTLFRDNRELNSMFPQRVHMPSFDIDDLKDMLFMQLDENSLQICQAAYDEVIKEMKVMIKINRTGILKAADHYIKAIVDVVETRKARKLIAGNFEAKSDENDSVVTLEDVRKVIL